MPEPRDQASVMEEILSELNSEVLKLKAELAKYKEVVRQLRGVIEILEQLQNRES